MYFDELDLNNNVLDALYDMRFDVCTPVQEKCIPEILKGNDVLGVAQTGTGKTAAYLLPILSKLDDGNYPKDSVNCVIMSPTRELAQQIDQAFQGFGYYLNGVSSVAVYGGNDGNRFDQETKGMRMGADVVIATPGRLISHINIGNVDLGKTSFFVLDEADRMLDMGFSDDILSIAKLLPKDCQIIMFSATMPRKIEELAKTLLKNPVEIKLAVSKPAEKIQQRAFVCYESQKLEIVKWLFEQEELKRVIVFCGKKQKVKEVSRALAKAQISVGEMHSDLTQAERDDMMFRFKSGQIDVLVATDIVARGIDIDDIAMVINYDVPHDAEDYVHRIGRTARADRDGVAITLVSEADIPAFKEIEYFLEKEVDKNPLPEGVGEGPDYKAGRKKAKAVRRQSRDTNAHKHKPRRNKEERPRKEKEETPRMEVADVQAVAMSETQEQKSAKRKKRRPANRYKDRPEGAAVENNKDMDDRSANPVDRKERDSRPANATDRKAKDSRSANPADRKAKDNRSTNPADRKAKDNRSTHPADRKAKDNRSANPADRKAKDNRSANPADRKAKDGNSFNPADRKAKDERLSKQPRGERKVVEKESESGLKKLFRKPLKWLKSLSGK